MEKDAGYSTGGAGAARRTGERSVPAGAAEAAFATFGGRVEGIDHVQADLHDGLEQQLRDALAWLNVVRRLAVVGQQDFDFSVVVGVDHTDTLGDADAVLQR